MRQRGLQRKDGSAALYAVVILPVVMTLTVLGVDFAAWQSVREHLQEEADTIALEAARYLPNGVAARDYLESYKLRVHEEREVQYTLLEEPNGVQVSLRSSFQPWFAQFIAGAVGSDQGLRFTAERVSSAAVTPQDLIIIFQDGHSLRPALGDNPWEPNFFPTSQFWQCTNVALPGGADPIEQQAMISQACFNPVLTGLKSAAITLVDQLSAAPDNRIGLIFTPGEISSVGFAVARGLIDGGAGFPGGYFMRRPTVREGNWSGYLDLATFSGDNACVLQSAFDSRYALQPPPAPYRRTQSESGICGGTPLRTQLCNAGTTYQELLQPCYFEDELLLREMIYWHSARTPTAGGFSAEPNPVAALERAVAELSLPVSQGDLQKRGNFAHRVERLIVSIGDSLPEPNDSRLLALLPRLEGLQAKVFFLVLEHPQQPSVMRSRVTAFEAAPPSDRLRVLVTTNPDDLAQKLIPFVIAQGRRYAIRI